MKQKIEMLAILSPAGNVLEVCYGMEGALKEWSLYENRDKMKIRTARVEILDDARLDEMIDEMCRKFIDRYRKREFEKS